jgi:hypothetical protein
VALVYDFDGTLARGNIQEHSFIPELGIDVVAFWREVKDAARPHDADESLVYMQQMRSSASTLNTTSSVWHPRDHPGNADRGSLSR